MTETNGKAFLTRDFFIRPVAIPCVFTERVEKDGEVETVEHKVIFHFNRESVFRTNESSIAMLLLDNGANDSLALLREKFCRQLVDVPEIFKDFPREGTDTPLYDLALEYFSAPGFDTAIIKLMEEFNRIQSPVDLFRGI
jgi:hypothetical protein